MLKRFYARNRQVQTFTGQNLAVFLDRRPPHSEFKDTKLSKGTCINRNTTFEPLSVQFGPTMRPVAGRGSGKRKKEGRRKSQNRYLSPRHGGAILQPICTIFGEFVDLTDIITLAKFGFKIFIVFFQAERWKNAFSL